MATLADVLHTIVDLIPVPGDQAQRTRVHEQIAHLLEEVTEDVAEDATA